MSRQLEGEETSTSPQMTESERTRRIARLVWLAVWWCFSFVWCFVFFGALASMAAKKPWWVKAIQGAVSTDSTLGLALMELAVYQLIFVCVLPVFMLVTVLRLIRR